MKKLSDYEGEEAIILWGELFDPMTAILSDKKITKALTDKKTSFFDIAKQVLQKYPKEINTILTRIDDEEINAANILSKLIIFLMELITNGKATAFFSFAGPEDADDEYSGSATENTGDGLK